MCKYGDTIKVLVSIPADLSCSGKARRKWKRIDRCIAPIVKALQKGGIKMRGSCCGHGKRRGHIELARGRTLIIKRRKFKEKS